jgi:Transposase zinc-binding domain
MVLTHETLEHAGGMRGAEFIWLTQLVSFRWSACRSARLVVLSCKGRGLCPSCGDKRMTDLAAHVVDRAARVVAYRREAEMGAECGGTCSRQKPDRSALEACARSELAS